MTDASLPTGRAVADPVLIIEDKPLRAGEVLAQVESLGLRGRVVPTQSMYAVPGTSDRYSLVILRVPTLGATDLSNAAAVHRSSPSLPILLICDEKNPGDSPWPNCTVMASAGVVKKLRIHVSDLLGISLSDQPGSTLKE